MRLCHLLSALFFFGLMPALAGADATPVMEPGNRIAAARDAVQPMVVSILVVREDFRQGVPALSVSSGSGTVVTAQGHIATNAHVTDKGKSFRVVFSDGRELPAKLVGVDTLSDLAVLQALPEKSEVFAYAAFAETLDLLAGDTVLAMGAPWGLSNSMSAGIVNNPRRLLVSLFDDEADYEDRLGDDQPTGRYYAWIQHDAAIAPGNSGGPLVDLRGRIVGVNTRGMILGGDLAFAIPGPDAAGVVRSLIAQGEIRRVHLGIRLRSLKGTDFNAGVLVNAVERGSEAETAGLRAGDRLLTLNGTAINALQPVDVPAVQRLVAELPIDSEVRLLVERDGKQRTLQVRARVQPASRGDDAAFAPFGVSVTALTPAMSRRRNLDQEAGLLVTGIRPGGPAAIARPALREGDILRRVAGKPVADIDVLRATPLRTGAALQVEFERDGEQHLALLTPRAGDIERVPLPELSKVWAGAEVQPITNSLARELHWAGPGYRITRLYDAGPLKLAGARVGDLLTSIDGEALKPANESSDSGFHERIRDFAHDSEVSFAVLRDGKPLTLKARLVPSPTNTAGLKTLAVSRLRAELRELGFYDRVARRLPADQSGVLIDGVEPGGPAGLAHLQGGDLVIRLEHERVRDPQSLSQALDRALARNGERLIALEVIRGSETRIFYLDRTWLDITKKD